MGSTVETKKKVNKRKTSRRKKEDDLDGTVAEATAIKVKEEKCKQNKSDSSGSNTVLIERGQHNRQINESKTEEKPIRKSADINKAIRSADNAELSKVDVPKRMVNSQNLESNGVEGRSSDNSKAKSGEQTKTKKNLKACGGKKVILNSENSAIKSRSKVARSTRQNSSKPTGTSEKTTSGGNALEKSHGSQVLHSKTAVREMLTSRVESKEKKENPTLKEELSKIISPSDSPESLNLLDTLLRMYEQMDGSAAKLTEQIRLIAEGGGEMGDSSSMTKGTDGAKSASMEKQGSVVVDEPKKEVFCRFCQKIAETRCTGCRTVFYCSKECQKNDWPGHKDACRPFSVTKRKGIGRVLIASRDIPTDDVILRDRPLVIGPKQATEPLCLRCYREVSGLYRCSKCSWPLCGQKCEEDTDSYHKYECGLTRKAGFKVNMDNVDVSQYVYEAVIVLRCLGVKANDPKKWSSIADKLNNRFNFTYREGTNEGELFTLIREQFKVDNSEEEIFGVIGLLQTSRVSVKLPYAEVDSLFPNASLLSHSCLPNTRLLWDSEDNSLVVKASEDIKKGDLITTIQTDILWGTRARRDHLKQSRLIFCSCKRCADPTECGTYFGSLLCRRCHPKKCAIVSTDPLDDDAQWECVKCQHKVDSGEVLQTTLNLGAQVAETLMNPSIDQLESLLKRWETVVHTNHYHFHAVKHSLLQLYAREEEKNEEKSGAHFMELQKKEKACKEFLRVCSLIDPSISYTASYIGLTFFEYHKPILQGAKRSFGAGKLTTEQLKKRLYLAKALLKKSMEMFKNEPIDTPEGQLFVTSKEEFVSIGMWMRAVGLV